MYKLMSRRLLQHAGDEMRGRHAATISPVEFLAVEEYHFPLVDHLLKLRLSTNGGEKAALIVGALATMIMVSCLLMMYPQA